MLLLGFFKKKSLHEVGFLKLKNLPWHFISEAGKELLIFTFQNFA